MRQHGRPLATLLGKYLDLVYTTSAFTLISSYRWAVTSKKEEVVPSKGIFFSQKGPGRLPNCEDDNEEGGQAEVGAQDGVDSPYAASHPHLVGCLGLAVLLDDGQQ